MGFVQNVTNANQQQQLRGDQQAAQAANNRAPVNYLGAPLNDMPENDTGAPLNDMP